MQLIAFIVEAKVAKRILDHLGENSTGPPVARPQYRRRSVSPLAVAQLLRERIPRATLAVVSGGTHAFANERPDEAGAAIRAHFEASLAPRAG